jgi:oxygen-independent coproporphyrinogen-3 oxidase
MMAGAGLSLAVHHAPARELPIDYQELRHRPIAQHVRGALYRLFVGRNGWPLIFRPPHGDVVPGISPNLYVHLPFCSRICPHCPYNKTLYDTEQHARYDKSLREEITQYFRSGYTPPVETLYFGGGTPSVTPDLIEMVLELVRPHLKRDAEVGAEVHPVDASPELLRRLKNAGVNRVSLGVESFRADLLKKLGRGYTPEQAERAILAAREAGFACVDVNLICAIPGQSYLDTAADARRCIDLGVDQLSAYTLFTFVYTPLGEGVAQRRFPIYSDVSRIRSLWAISRVCRAAGFRRTSPWNYTRAGITPYSTVTRESYVGFGAGASSKVDGVFWFNTFSIDAYVAQERNRPAIVLKTDGRFRRVHWLYWQLYKTEVDGDRYRTLFRRDLDRDYSLVFALLRLLGMARRSARNWHVTERGAIWMHRLQQLFSITYIDDRWAQCKPEPWPQAVVLR